MKLIIFAKFNKKYRHSIQGFSEKKNNKPGISWLQYINENSIVSFTNSITCLKAQGLWFSETPCISL